MASKGKRKPSIHDLSREKPTPEELRKVVDQFSESDSPLVTAIMGVAFLEHELEMLIRIRIGVESNDGAWMRLVQEHGPFATFSSKIIFANSLGYIDDITKSALNTVKDIRNVFAHSKKIISFDNHLIVQKFKDLKLPTNTKSRDHKEYSTIKRANGAGQLAFRNLCLLIVPKLIKPQTAFYKSRSRTLQRKIDRFRQIAGPKTLTLAEALLAIQPPSSEGLQRQHEGTQNADPKALAGLQTLADLVGTEPFGDGSKGK